MTWVRLDHGFPWNKDILPLSDAAYRLFVNALCYCNLHETDGDMSEVALKVVANGMPPGRRRNAVTELVDGGLWDRTTTGYAIHNYLKFQPSKAHLEAQRQKFSELGKKGMASRWNNGTSNAANNATHNEPNNPSVTTVTSRPSNFGFQPKYDPRDRERFVFNEAGIVKAVGEPE